MTQDTAPTALGDATLDAMSQPAPEVPPHWQDFLAIDLGLKRTGVAVGTRLLGSARGLPTVRAEGKARLAALVPLVAEWQPQALVIGVPRHPDGAPHEMTAAALKFARQLRTRFDLPVLEVDERYSTTEAQAQGVRDADAGAACVILEQFFRSLA